MFFNNLLIYRLYGDSNLDGEVLAEALGKFPARPCGSQVSSTYGFVAPTEFGEEPPLVHECQGYMAIATQREERILPASVIRDAVAEKVTAIELEESRKVYKKEKDQIKDEVVQALMPRAFIRKSVTQAAIDPATGLVYINTSSTKKAEELLSAMREALGSLPVRPISLKDSPMQTFTHWLKTHEADGGFFILDECELRDTAEDGGIVRIKRDDLSGDEVKAHLDAGKLAVSLRMAWEDKLSFVLDDKLNIKRLRFEELLQNQAEADGGDDKAGQHDASFVLMMLTFREFVPKLLDALGGEDVATTV